ncbi:hypothetical protein [Streptacidiphilus jiangxiensis]|uniref:Uncharacterized protein n=1 Tax=Streptacidiphilus jiangxiensis TaxID=235985 RepID=A0A1H7S9B8_STRJI|nr:hypothetical protein [Streptacidiphilus jiangxiensis]SEL69135.1 hypothetical protein SAMN05414137_111239 [Streptacidiphilus jiangxiensis]
MGHGFLGRWRGEAPQEQPAQEVPPEVAWQVAALDEALHAFGRRLEEAASAGPAGSSPVDAHPPTEAEQLARDHLTQAQDAYQDALERAATARLDRDAERGAVFLDLRRGRAALRLHDDERAHSMRLTARIAPLREALSACRPPAGDPHAETELAKAEAAFASAVAAADGVAQDRDQLVEGALGKGGAALARIESRRLDEAHSTTLVGALQERVDLARADLAAEYAGATTPTDLVDGLRTVERQLRRARQSCAPTTPGSRLPAVRTAVASADAELEALETRRETARQARSRRERTRAREAEEHPERELAQQAEEHAERERAREAEERAERERAREAEERAKRQAAREREAEERERTRAREAEENAERTRIRQAEERAERERVREERERVREEREGQRRALQLAADIAALQAEVAAARPSWAEREADPVLTAEFGRAERALQTATANARGDDDDERRARAVAALRSGRAALDALAEIRRETPELADAVRAFRVRLAEAKRGEPMVDATVAAEYREARHALDEARSALRVPGPHRTARVFAAIGAGRAALLRMACRQAGQPVPPELARPEELGRPDWERTAGR